MKKYCLLFISSILLSCNVNNGIDTFQSTRNKVTDVKKYVHEIDLGDIYVNTFAIPAVIGDYFVVRDMKAYDKPINVFDRNSYNHITSFGTIGEGPNEISVLGHLGWNDTQREIYVLDNGKMLVYAYNIDSVIVNPEYNPIEKYKLNDEASSSEFYYVNDTISYCRTMIPTGVNSHTQCTGKWNMKTGDIEFYRYDHPKIHKKRYFLAVSYKDSLYAECNYLYDMINIFDLKGNNKKNIYGPQWGETNLQCHSDATFTKDYLVTVYNGERYEKYEPSNKCLLFSKTGYYLATLNIGYNIVRMCYDEVNDRLIFTFNDKVQFGYIDLKEIIL